jgi:antitoxin ParD1/3/4
MLRKTITITEPMEAWVKAQIEAGRYANDSEYFRDLIRRDKDQRSAEEQLGRMIDDAEASGICDKTVEEIWQEAIDRFKAKNG